MSARGESRAKRRATDAPRRKEKARDSMGFTRGELRKFQEQLREHCRKTGLQGDFNK